eukprot:scaffold7684_cov119-Isochrysis_galbana.AAC.1
MEKEWGRGERVRPDGRRTEASCHVAASEVPVGVLSYEEPGSRWFWRCACRSERPFVWSVDVSGVQTLVCLPVQRAALVFGWRHTGVRDLSH